MLPIDFYFDFCIEDPPIAAVEPAEIENPRHSLDAISRRLR